jgi:hypothetical protein
MMKSGEIDSDARRVSKVMGNQDVKEFLMFVRDFDPEKAGSKFLREVVVVASQIPRQTAVSVKI